MRIAMLSVHTCPLAALGGKETGGMNVYVRELSRELGERGLLIDIYTRQQDPAAPRTVEVWPHVRVIHVPAGPVAPYPKGEVYQHLPQFVEGVRALMEEEGVAYDLYHSHYWLSAWVARELQRSHPAPILHMFHTLGKMKDAVARTPEEREIDVRSGVEGEIMGFVDRIVAATPLDKEQMIELYDADPAKIEVIPCGVDPEMFHPIPKAEAKAHLGGPLADCRMVLFVGRLDPVKGLDTLLKAMCDLTRRTCAEKARKYCLAIVGGDAESAAEAMQDADCLEDIRKTYDLPDLVMFLGARAQEMLAYYYSAAEVCVIPSRYESFGMVALEAMACGTPVIASRVGGLIYTVQDGVTGFLVPDRDPAALADKIDLILSDAGLRDRLGAQALEVTHHFTWGNIAERITQLYQEMLSGGSLGPGSEAPKKAQ